MKIFACPFCGSQRVRLSRRRGFGRWVRRLVCIRTLRCDACGRRFRSRTVRWRYILYAKCPHCAGLVLTNWQEKYHFPAWYSRSLIYLGWREQRCEDCRHNFVSLRPRFPQKKMVPSDP